MVWVTEHRTHSDWAHFVGNAIDLANDKIQEFLIKSLGNLNYRFKN